MTYKILVRRGTSEIPALDEGEPGFAIDSQKLYIGTAGGNVNVAHGADDRYELLASGRVNIAISYTSSTGTIWTPSAAVIITQCMIIRTTAWDGAPSLTVGKSGTPTWLTLAAQAKLTTALPAGELAGVETINCRVYANATTPVVATWDQGGASAGAGYIVIGYLPLT